MQKIKNYIKSLSELTKVILSVSIGIHFVWSFYSTSQSGSFILPRVIGAFLGSFFFTLVASSVIAIFPYLIFRSVAETYNKYLDYLTFTFLLVTVAFLIGSYKSITMMHLFLG